MKYCKDCKWAFAGDTVHCAHPDLMEKDPVYGAQLSSPIANRRDDLKCGQDAKLFEPRGPGFWNKVKNALLG